jgi:hypothetical protein
VLPWGTKGCVLKLRWITIALGLGASLCATAMAEASPLLLPGDGADANHERLQPGLYPAAPGSVDLAPPPEPHHLGPDIDWSVGFRGSYVTRQDEARFEASLLPQASLTDERTRSLNTFEVSADIALPVETETHLNGFNLSLASLYRLDAESTVGGNASLVYDAPSAFTPGSDPTIAQPAASLSGSAGGSVTREFGRFALTGSGSVLRTVYGETVNADGTTTDNTARNLWGVSGGLRLSYALTPILTVYGDATAGRDVFDAVDPGSGLSADAWGTAFSAGVIGRWDEILEAEASIGAGMRRYDEAALDEISSTLFAARLTFRPDQTLAVTASARQTLEPSGADTSGFARIATTAEISAAYTVNSWLTLRSSANWYSARFAGTPNTESGHGAGMGADYLVNAHTQLSADYGYVHTNSSTSSPEDSHRVTVGITVQR